MPPQPAAGRASPLAAWGEQLGEPTLRATFGIGFCILFAFLGTFTYINFVLAAPPFRVGMMMLGIVYFVFLPSIFTTPLAGRVVGWFGPRPALLVGLGVAAAGLPLLVLPSLSLVLLGLVLVGVGTFLAQAITTGVLGRAARRGRAAASGLYLFSYYLGGLIGTAVLGRVYELAGWGACVAGIAGALALAAALSTQLRLAPAP
jgi:predicted MFS family arabinose efflux permease